MCLVHGGHPLLYTLSCAYVSTCMHACAYVYAYTLCCAYACVRVCLCVDACVCMCVYTISLLVIDTGLSVGAKTGVVVG